MPKYIVTAISQFRMNYVVECKNEEHALDTVSMEEVQQEFSQLHLGETIVSSRRISDEEYLELFDKENSYLTSWSDEQKFQFVHQVDYPEDWEFS
jgi:hypothetical protein